MKRITLKTRIKNEYGVYDNHKLFSNFRGIRSKTNKYRVLRISILETHEGNILKISNNKFRDYLQIGELWEFKKWWI